LVKDDNRFQVSAYLDTFDKSRARIACQGFVSCWCTSYTAQQACLRFFPNQRHSRGQHQMQLQWRLFFEPAKQLFIEKCVGNKPDILNTLALFCGVLTQNFNSKQVQNCISFLQNPQNLHKIKVPQLKCITRSESTRSSNKTTSISATTYGIKRFTFWDIPFETKMI